MGREQPKPVPVTEALFEATKEEHKGEPTSTGSMFHLSPHQLLVARDKALQGDVDSAVKLYEFYTFSAINSSERLLWMRESAELGSAKIQYIYSLYLLQEGDRDGAAEWANISFLNGYVKAKELLSNL